MNLDLTNKNALVGGSSKGIGKAIAVELASLGAEVTLIGRTEELLQSNLKELDISKGQQHGYLKVDYSDHYILEREVKELLQSKNIHILINNTGGPGSGPILAAQHESFVAGFHNHVLTNQLLTNLVLAGMKRDSYGRIINVVSTSTKSPIPGLGVSNTIRGAVASWAKSVANEIAPFGITVNNVLPGFTDTGRLKYIIEKRAEQASKPYPEMVDFFKSVVPMARFATPKEIASAAAFLASPSAAYITGTSILVDGGRTKSLS